MGWDIQRRTLPRQLVLSDGSLEVTHDQFAGGALLDVCGLLDAAHAAVLGVAVHHALGPRPKRLVIDLSRVTSVDMRGLAVLLGARRRSRRSGVELTLACNVPSTLKLLAATRLDRDLDVHPTRGEAIGQPAPL